MFKLNETYFTKAGYKARIICVDATYKYGAKLCPVVALIDVPTTVTASGQIVYFFSEDGKYCSVGKTSYDLVSNDPTEEEARLIEQIGDYCEGHGKDREEQLLKIIRQLRSIKKA